MIVGSLVFKYCGQTKKEVEMERELVFSRGYMLFLLTPARTVMAASRPMRSSFRLGWRI